MQILTGKITAGGQDDFNVVLIDNPLNLKIDWEQSETGTYTGTCFSEIFNSDAPPRWWIADSQGSKYVLSQLNRTQIEIAAYNKDGNKQNGILNIAIFEVWV